MNVDHIRQKHICSWMTNIYTCILALVVKQKEMSWWLRGEDGEEAMYQDTDSDVAEQRDCGKVKVKWTQEEDDNLKALVQNLGPNDWKHIASFLLNRSEHQCQHRWLKVLDPKLVKGPWTKEEDEKSKTPKSEPDTPGGELNTNSWVVNSSGFLSPNGPGLKEVMDMVDGDLEGWCNMSVFDLPEESQSPERTQFRLEGSAVQELSKGNRGELIPISPGGITPPSILTRRSHRRISLSPDSNNSRTPKSTPVKNLPFSPSQFLNMWNKQDSFELENPSLTSTPVCSQKSASTTPLHREKTPLTQKENSVFASKLYPNSVFITPNHKSNHYTTPWTPTPFKNATEKYDPLRPLPQTPNEEDLKEVLLKETGIELIVTDESPLEQRRKQVHQPPMKKVRKSLALDVMDCKETVTARHQSVKFQPQPCPKREDKEKNVLDQGFCLGPSESCAYSKPVPTTPMSQAWEAVVCGRTKDQLIMTEKARCYLRSLKSHAPNRALILS